MAFEIRKAKKKLQEYRDSCKNKTSFGKHTAINGVDCFLHNTESVQKCRPLFLFLHGGSWVGGDAVELDSLCKTISEKTDCLAVNINYTKLDVKPFPTPMEEVLKVIAYFNENDISFHIDPNKTVICGCSAGGHLAAGTAILAKQRNIKIARQILVYPFVDWTGKANNPVTQYGIMGVPLKKWEKLFFKNMKKDDPCLSPLAAENTELAGIAPADIIVCGNDDLREHGIIYCEKLKDAGIETTLKEYENALHGFLEVNRPDFSCDNPAKDEEQASYTRDCEEYIINIINNL